MIALLCAVEAAGYVAGCWGAWRLLRNLVGTS